MRRLRVHKWEVINFLLGTVLGVSLDVVGLIWSSYDGEARRLEAEENMALTREVLEQLRQGRDPHGLDAWWSPASDAVQGIVTAAPVRGQRRRQLRTGGRVDAPLDAHVWIGVLSGVEYWPLQELTSADISESFEYSVTLPQRVSSGSVMLVHAGPAAQQLFATAAADEGHDVGLVFTMLRDATPIVSANFSME